MLKLVLETEEKVAKLSILDDNFKKLEYGLDSEDDGQDNSIIDTGNESNYEDSPDCMFLKKEEGTLKWKLINYG